MYLWQRQHAQAITEGEQAITTLNSNNVSSYLTLTETLAYEKVIAAFKRVISRHPNHFGAHFLLAATYGELGWKEKVQAEVEEILRINPNFPTDL